MSALSTLPEQLLLKTPSAVRDAAVLGVSLHAKNDAHDDDDGVVWKKGMARM
jgi:hypothetical protein